MNPLAAAVAALRTAVVGRSWAPRRRLRSRGEDGMIGVQTAMTVHLARLLRAVGTSLANDFRQKNLQE